MTNHAQAMRCGPSHQAEICGNCIAPKLHGTVNFYPCGTGTLVELELYCLPARCEPFAVHIHAGGCCTPEDFSNAGEHLTHADIAAAFGRPATKIQELHPCHAGDLPAIFSNDGYAYMLVYTNRFQPCEVANRTVVIHEGPDDYHSQPSGNAGNRMGCGAICCTHMRQ